jgi:uncharacterized protein YdeI (YjbR/CyaY-like superfamily)
MSKQPQQEPEVFYPKNVTEWRAWLAENHLSKQSVWVVFHAKSSATPSISWSEAVDVALCFGWIDSKKIKVGPTISHQYFTKRKPKSNWSRINKEKIEKLTASGEMTQAGLQAVEIAKQNGSWTLVDSVEDMIIPSDLEQALTQHHGAKDYFMNLSKTIKKMMLYWVISAKREATRQNRINEIAQAAAQQQKPKQF